MKRIGVAMCGSHCCFDKVFPELERLAEEYELIPVMSEAASGTDTRFGTAAEHRERLAAICGMEPIVSVKDAEPLGPAVPLDALLIAPCTGNTLGKLAHGITDGPVTMAAKAHLRNGRPLVIAFSTNDGLSGSAESIARLLNRRSVYFVPFGQDDSVKKPRSLASDFTLIGAAVGEALSGRQLQPVLSTVFP